MSDTPATPPERITLRHLPLSARVAISTFLISVGIGYFSALVQLHFQHAKPGELFPNQGDAARLYSGYPPMSTLERLLRADEHLPFNGGGSMRSAFFKRSAGWTSKVREKARNLKVPEEKGLLALRQEREYEIDALLFWIKEGGTKETFEDQQLPDDFFKPQRPDEKFFEKTDFFSKAADGTIHSNVKEIFNTRCVRCHDGGGGGAAGQIDLKDWEHISDWIHDKGIGGNNGMSLTKLAQTTHVHLLGFSMLYGLTGIILAFSSYPGWLRLILCPLPLIAQVVDISCWWLARFDPIFAHFIIYTGGVVAIGLMLHIVLSLLNMYGVAGKLVLLLMFAGAAGGGYVLKTQIIDPYLVNEKNSMSMPAP
jgi:hypothetical protein